MNSKDRFLSAIRCQPVDRQPVACVVTGITISMMEETGVYWPAAHHDAKKMMVLAETIWTNHRVESIKLPFDMTVETQALGAAIHWGDLETLPTELRPAFHHPDDLIIPEDFLDLGRVPIVLNATSLLRQRYDTEVPVISSIVGPFTLAAKLFGFENFFTWLVTNPDYIHQILEQLTGLAIKYAAALTEAGADAILIGEASCSGSLISANFYNKFVAPYHTHLCSSVTKPSILHICGKSTNHTRHLLQSGVNAFSFDEASNIELISQHLKGKVALIGFLPTIHVLLEGTPEAVRQASFNCLDRGVDVLAPGCSLPPHTPSANIAEMVESVRDWNINRRL